MRKYLFTALLCSLTQLAIAALPDVPDAPKTDAKYIIYLHGIGVENYGPGKADEDYYGIIKTIEGRGFTVISEVRRAAFIMGKPSGTKPDEYGRKVAKQVKTLIEKGVPPENITVVGYSKGGVITLVAAADADNAKVNYVIMAGCFQKSKEKYDEYAENIAPKMKGRILSMYDAADPNFGTCQDFFSTAGDKVSGKEIKFETGQGHALFRKPVDSWINPLVDWANGK